MKKLIKKEGFCQCMKYITAFISLSSWHIRQNGRKLSKLL